MSKWFYFWIGILTGLVFISSALFLSPVMHSGKQAEKLIQQCQKDLPRDQYCTIIAIPENEIEE